MITCYFCTHFSFCNKRKGDFNMFILTDGKNYVMKNPIKETEYLSTTSPIQATEFHYKQARSLLQRREKKLSWLKKYEMVDVDSGETVNKNYMGNAGVFIGKNDIDFDESILEKIMNESNSIMGLAGWDKQQLETYKNTLSVALSKYDSAVSDIEHALQKYKKSNKGKKPQAHKMAQIGYLLDDVRYMHEKIKQCIACICVMQDALTYKYDINKLQLELSKARYSDYKGRTEYFKIALEILGEKTDNDTV